MALSSTLSFQDWLRSCADHEEPARSELQGHIAQLLSRVIHGVLRGYQRDPQEAEQLVRSFWGYLVEEDRQRLLNFRGDSMQGLDAWLRRTFYEFCAEHLS